MNRHLWKGQWIDDARLDELIEILPAELAAAMERPLSPGIVIRAASGFIEAFDKKFFGKILLDKGLSQKDIDLSFRDLFEFMGTKKLKAKVVKELGGLGYQDFERVSYEKNIFESTKPLGVLTHVTPSNSPVVAFLALVEGLLSGNINILKVSSKESDFPFHAIQLLCNCDSQNILKDYVIALRISSKERRKLAKIFSLSNGISVWGGDQAVTEVKNMASAQTRIISWGHKISFAYVTSEFVSDDGQMTLMAQDCINMEQQACSSPQCIFIETEDFEEVKSFAKKFSVVFERESEKNPQKELEVQQRSEITNVTELCKLDSLIDGSVVYEGKNKDWRILVEKNSELKASPLYRTIWIKPLPSDRICKNLFPWRNYLQTAALVGDFKKSNNLISCLIGAGVSRITRPGEMLQTYEGEPHDGCFALQEFTRKVRVQMNGADGIYRFGARETIETPVERNKISTKEDFQNLVPDNRLTRLFFKSGGSSGKTALSYFSYDDYHWQMRCAAEGLYAAGLEPDKDRVMNLFFGGGLYGGMISFFTILEYLKAYQYTMGAWHDHTFVARTIIEQKIDVIIGMPSYILQMINNNIDLFREYRGIKKIFYGGEYLPEKQREFLKCEIGVELIRSASYGSVDAGPLGYQCRFSEGNIHHLHDNLHSFEILKMDLDEPVNGNEPGRLIITTPEREAMAVERYEIGDVGRWVEGRCACGSDSPRFELLGRLGDIFKAGGPFLNYTVFEKILKKELSYAGRFQIVLEDGSVGDVLTLNLEKKFASDLDVREIILNNYLDLNEVVKVERCLEFIVGKIEESQFVRTVGSGKLIRVLDRR